MALPLLLAGATAAHGRQQVAAAAPDPDLGRQLTAACAACHGADGGSPALPSYPNIAGQNFRYLERQLRLMREGERPPGLMAGQLDGFSDEELGHMAAFYAAQTPPVGRARPDGIALGEAIYRGGLLRKQVAACTACHAPDGGGNAPAGFPALSGQQPEYAAAQLVAYREGRRTTDEAYGAMMRQTAEKLTDGEIDAVANYLHGLH